MTTNEEAEQAATVAAEAWLALIDRGEIAESWRQAATLFKAAVTEEQWQAALAAAASPLGKPLSRVLKSAQYVDELPGAPDGEYVVVEYATAFERKRNGTETITPMHDPDGVWRVSGYFIR